MDVQELLADLGKRIAEEEIKVRERINRITHMANPADVEDQIREEWHKFHLAIKPMEEHRDYVIKQLVQIEACKPPAPIVMPAGHTRLP
jgi:hypothetical protein